MNDDNEKPSVNEEPIAPSYDEVNDPATTEEESYTSSDGAGDVPEEDDTANADGDKDGTVALPEMKPQNVKVDRPIQGPLDSAKQSMVGSISLLRHGVDEINALIESMPKLKLGASEAEAKWFQAVREGTKHILEGKAFTGSLEREDSEWAQIISHDNKPMAIGRPSLGLGNESRLTGEKALYHVMGAVGLGSIVQVPLWHTGIWVKIKAPTDSSLLILDQQLAEEKVRLGAMSNGMVFSNTSVFLNRILIDFAIECIYESTVKDANSNKLKSIIKQTDYPTLIWGLACAIYPEGYPYKRPCVMYPSKCMHIEEALLSLPRLTWTDKSMLNQMQIKHMVNRNARHSLEQIKLYQDNHKYQEGKEVAITDRLRISLSVPNLDEHIEAGDKWVSSIIHLVETNLGADIDEHEKERYIYEHGRATLLQQYSHWVKSIGIVDDEHPEGMRYIDEEDAVAETLGALSSNIDISNRILEEIGKYIDEATISVIGIPRYSCPSCKQPQIEEHEKGDTHIIPLDVDAVFFTLRRQRIGRVRTEG